MSKVYLTRKEIKQLKKFMKLVVAVCNITNEELVYTYTKGDNDHLKLSVNMKQIKAIHDSTSEQFRTVFDTLPEDMKYKNKVAVVCISKHMADSIRSILGNLVEFYYDNKDIVERLITRNEELNTVIIGMQQRLLNEFSIVAKIKIDKHQSSASKDEADMTRLINRFNEICSTDEKFANIQTDKIRQPASKSDSEIMSLIHRFNKICTTTKKFAEKRNSLEKILTKFN